MLKQIKRMIIICSVLLIILSVTQTSVARYYKKLNIITVKFTIDKNINKLK